MDGRTEAHPGSSGTNQSPSLFPSAQRLLFDDRRNAVVVLIGLSPCGRSASYSGLTATHACIGCTTVPGKVGGRILVVLLQILEPKKM